jgi:hypothetical protein
VFNTSNGWQSNNGLNSINGLNVSNGLNSVNGLASAGGLMTSSAGQAVVKYMAKCALASGDSLVKQDQNGNNYTFPGGLGLAPQWKTAGCNQACTEQISACLMAHINTSGTHIPLWIDGPEASIGWGQSPWFPTREGTFFGQIMVTNANNNLDAYYCDGPSTDENVVPGRLGSAQCPASNPNCIPYANAWPTSAGMDGRCGNSLTAHSTGGCVDNAAGDGATSCALNGTTWQYPLTVWRGQTFQAEDAQGGAWMNNGNGCTPGTGGCSFVPGALGFIASQCSTPGSNGCAIIVDSNNGMGKRVGYFNGPSKGLKFSGVNAACAGTANLVIYTTNGDAVGTYNRQLSFIVNGGSPQTVTFEGQNDWSHPVGTTISLSGFNQGTNNTLYITAAASGGAPDVDWIEIVNAGGACSNTSVTGTCDQSKWVESANVNSSTASLGDDGNFSTRYTTGAAMAAGDYYQVDMTGTVYLSGIVLNNNSDASAQDFASTYDVYSSNDGVNWTKMVSGFAGQQTTTIPFTKTLMRYFRVQINNTGGNTSWWSIGELQTTCATQ